MPNIHSLESVQKTAPSRNAKFAALGPIAARHGQFPKGTVLPETRVLVCPRVKLHDLPEGFVPEKYYSKNLMYNQQVKICCRHPENYAIEGWKSHPDEDAPDQYHIICIKCNAVHRYWLLGAIDDVPRPVWKCD